MRAVKLWKGFWKTRKRYKTRSMEMNEKPILFSTEMVQAILKNQKTMTRRVIVPQPPEYVRYFVFYNGMLRAYLPMGEPCVAPGSTGPLRIQARYNIGDRLWVRETWGISNKANSFRIVYKVPEFSNPFPEGFPRDLLCDKKWKSGRFMPRRCARLFLEVTDIKAERLQDITETDAIREGVLDYEGWRTRAYQKALEAAVAAGTKPPLGLSPRERFFHLWDKLNKKREYGVEINPWTIAYTFKKAPAE
jgi:hypothetical protein